MNRILVVEDEAHLAQGLRFNLESDGYKVTVAETGEQALETIARVNSEFDAIILDVMLPGIDGFTVAAELRKQGMFVPILMLTARGRAEDVLSGFESGADDYITKPFELPILLARLKGLLRRSNWHRVVAAPEQNPPEPQRTDPFQFSGKVINFNELELVIGEKVVPLTLMEVNLLRYLVQHEGQIVSRKQILDQVWGVREDTDTRAIDNFIVRLRKYIEDEPSKPTHLLTVRGVGYKFVAQPR